MQATMNRIAMRAGTYRTATAEQTWDRVAPMLGRFGITRVADITRLDEIGLPVHVAYRPTGRTLAVSIGTGATSVQSRVSAVMESIEAWHAENPRLGIAQRSPASGLDLPYDVRCLPREERSLLTREVVLDWVQGRGLLTGAPYLVPYDTIYLDYSPRRSWAHVLFRPSSNGLASGNTKSEATLHALFELIERDCITGYTGPDAPEFDRVDPGTAAAAETRAVVAALRRAGCRMEVVDIANGIGLPCYAATIWSAAVPLVCGGFGCHLDPDIAVGRALTEAAQSRLCAVSGARDDIDGTSYGVAPPIAEVDVGRQPVRRMDVDRDADIDELVRRCAQRLLDHTGVEPFVVDLTHDDVGIPVSKVFAPGLALFDEHRLATHERRSRG